jgi:hypothetical protein
MLGNHSPSHPWKARVFVALTMLALSFIGLVVTDVTTTGGWDYWLWSIPAYALLALWLSWYLRLQNQSFSLVHIGYEICHWATLGASVILVSLFVQQGILGRISAGLCVLTLLAQAVFLAGLYIDKTFLGIGIILGLFAWIVSAATEYLYAISIPLLLVGGGVMAWLIWYSHKRHLPKS